MAVTHRSNQTEKPIVQAQEIDGEAACDRWATTNPIRTPTRFEDVMQNIENTGDRAGREPQQIHDITMNMIQRARCEESTNRTGVRSEMPRRRCFKEVRTRRSRKSIHAHNIILARIFTRWRKRTRTHIQKFQYISSQRTLIYISSRSATTIR